MSTIKVDTIQNTSGNPLYPVQVAVTMNGQGTIAIEQSLGVSSATDMATGKYRFNFTNAMSAANYYATVSSSYNSTSDGYNTYLGSQHTGCLDGTRATTYCHAGCWISGWYDPLDIGLTCIGEY